MAGDPITAIASAIAEASKAWGLWMASRERRHMRAALDAAERYIHVNEGLGENATLSEEEQTRILKKMRERFFKFN